MLFYSCGGHEHIPLNDGKISTNGIETIYSISCIEPEIGEIVTFVFDKIGDGDIGVILEINDNKVEIVDFLYSFNTTFYRSVLFPIASFVDLSMIVN